MLKYAIITPAHNEGRHLQRTIDSIRAQTNKPVRWVIVDDGSTDRTNVIARQAASEMDFILVVSTDRGGGHAFDHKARAFNLGVAQLAGLDYDLIGNLDADVSFGPSYFANLVRAFEKDTQLGVTGGAIFTTIGGRLVSYDRTLDSVAGAVQLFRRTCFEEIGSGYLPLTCGGEDAAAEIIAKSKGWRVEKSPTDRVDEHRETGTATATPLAARFQLGRRFHSLGYGPLFFAARCVYRITDEPILLGSCAQLCGYWSAALKREPVQLSSGVVQYLRQTQRRKLAHLRPPTVRQPAASNR